MVTIPQMFPSTDSHQGQAFPVRSPKLRGISPLSFSPVWTGKWGVHECYGGSSQPLPTGMLLERRGQDSGHQMGSNKRFPKGKPDNSPSHMLLDATQPAATVSVVVNGSHYFSLLLEFNVVQIKWGLYSLHGALLYPPLGLTHLSKREGKEAPPSHAEQR